MKRESHFCLLSLLRDLKLVSSFSFDSSVTISDFSMIAQHHKQATLYCSEVETAAFGAIFQLPYSFDLIISPAFLNRSISSSCLLNIIKLLGLRLSFLQFSYSTPLFRSLIVKKAKWAGLCLFKPEHPKGLLIIVVEQVLIETVKFLIITSTSCKDNIYLLLGK